MPGCFQRRSSRIAKVPWPVCKRKAIYRQVHKWEIHPRVLQKSHLFRIRIHFYFRSKKWFLLCKKHRLYTHSDLQLQYYKFDHHINPVPTMVVAHQPTVPAIVYIFLRIISTSGNCWYFSFTILRIISWTGQVFCIFAQNAMSMGGYTSISNVS